MKPTAKKGLIVVGVLYAGAIGILAWQLMAARRPELDTVQLQQRLNQLRSWAAEQDPEHVRTAEFTEKEAEQFLKDELAPSGAIINVNYTLLMQCLNFAVLLLLLYGFLWDPLLKMLDERRSRVHGELDEAAESRRQASELRQQRREELEKLRAERSDIMEQARLNAQQQRQEIVEQARREAERVSEQARERLQEEVRRARLSLREDVADLATDIAGRMLQREITAKDHQQTINEMLARMTTPADPGSEGDALQ